MKRIAKRNQEKIATTDEPTLAEPLPVQSEPSAPDAAPQEPADGFFFDRIAVITEAEWESRYVVYLYRTAPKINLPGERHYIARFNSSFDESSVLAGYGSGQYHARLNDRKLRKTVATHLFSVYDPNKPPSIDPALIVDCPENEPFLRWKKSDVTVAGSDTAASAVVAEIAREAMRKPKSSEVTDTLLLGMAQGRDTLAEKLASLTAKPPAADPIEALDRAVELIKKLTPNTPTADPIQTLDRAMDFLRKLQPAPVREKSEAQNDPLTYVGRVLDLADKLRPPQSAPAIPAGDGGSSLPAVAAIVASLAGLVDKPLNILMQVWAASKRATTGAPGAPTAAPLSPPPLVPPGPAQPGPGDAPDATQPAATAPPPVPPPQIIALAQQITPVMLKWLQADAPAAEQGAEFAAFVSDGWGLEDLKVLQNIGAAGIIDLYRRSPFWAMLALMEAKFEQFVQGFVEWRPAADDGEPDSAASEPEVIEL